MMNDNIATPFAKPLYVMLKPAGAHCNLACKYCYYLEKNNLYQNSHRHLMSDEMLEQFTREYIEGTGGPIVDIRSNEILEPVENLKQIPVEEK